MAGVHAGLIPLREERVLEDPRRPGGLPHYCCIPFRCSALKREFRIEPPYFFPELKTY